MTLCDYEQKLKSLCRYKGWDILVWDGTYHEFTFYGTMDVLIKEYPSWLKRKVIYLDYDKENIVINITLE